MRVRSVTANTQSWILSPPFFLSFSLFLFFSSIHRYTYRHISLDFNYQLRKKYSYPREKLRTVKGLGPMNFTTPRDKCAETRIPPSSVSAVNGDGEIYSVQEYPL